MEYGYLYMVRIWAESDHQGFGPVLNVYSSRAFMEGDKRECYMFDWSYENTYDVTRDTVQVLFCEYSDGKREVGSIEFVRIDLGKGNDVLANYRCYFHLDPVYSEFPHLIIKNDICGEGRTGSSFFMGLFYPFCVVKSTISVSFFLSI